MNQFFDPTFYPQQLKQKQQALRELLAPFSSPEPSVFPSPASHYRQRAEFKVWHEGERSFYAMFPDGKGAAPTLMREFPVASTRINLAMPALLDAVEASDVLRRKLFQVEFLGSRFGDLLITLVYHKPLDDRWDNAAQELQNTLNCSIIGRSRKQKRVLNKDYVEEVFSVGADAYRFKQAEGCFSQPNGDVCEAMLNWAVASASAMKANAAQHTEPSDLLELYCGNGNFTLPLAACFHNVLATEISNPLISIARENAKANQVSNVEFVRLAAEEVSQALKGEREFNRLKNIDLDAYRFSTVFVDPPRAGLDPATTDLVQGFDNILYISCNPWSLVENLKTLHQTHAIERAALFDQFPYTDHMECGVLLKRR